MESLANPLVEVNTLCTLALCHSEERPSRRRISSLPFHGGKYQRPLPLSRAFGVCETGGGWEGGLPVPSLCLAILTTLPPSHSRVSLATTLYEVQIRLWATFITSKTKPL